MWSVERVRDPAREYRITLMRDLPGFARPAVDWFRRRVIADYLREYQKRRPVDLDAVRYYEALRCLGFIIEGSEHLLAHAGRIERPIKPSAFGDRQQLEGIARRFEEITGVKKETVVTGEIDVRKRQERETEQVADTVRREKPHIDKEGDLRVRGKS